MFYLGFCENTDWPSELRSMAMSYHPSGGTIPDWTLGDRMRKSREFADLSQADMAAEIGISRASVVNYESGRYTPSRPVLLSWALRANVSYHWLCNGHGDDPYPEGPDQGVNYMHSWRSKLLAA